VQSRALPDRGVANPERFKALYRALSLRNLNDALTSLNRQPIRAVWRCAAAYGLDSVLWFGLGGANPELRID